MAITVNLYTLSKRENSTKRPDNDPVSFDCILKEPCSIIDPVISLNLGYTTDPAGYNYAHIPAFNRYYYISNWTWENGLWNASLSVDVLATYRAEIGDTNLYVLRAANEIDGSVIDTYYPTRTQSTFQVVTGSSPWTVSDVGQGTFVCGIVGKLGGPYGSATYYIQTPSQIQYMMADISSNYVTNNNGFSEDDATYALQKALIDPFGYIKSCMYFPIGLSAMPALSGLHNIQVGDVTLQNSNGYYVNGTSPYITGSISLALPNHPDAASRGDYVNAIYRKVYAVFPPFGTFDIDGTIACNYSYVVCRYTLDVISGNAVAEIGLSSSGGSIANMIARTEARVGVPIQLSSVYRDLFASNIAAARAGISAVGSALSMNLGGAISAAGNGILDAMEISRPKLETVGSAGSYASITGTPALYVQFLRPVDDDPAQNGRPLCKIRKPSALNGYMLIQDGDVSISGTMTEAAAIKAYLEGGFYYE